MDIVTKGNSVLFITIMTIRHRYDDIDRKVNSFNVKLLNPYTSLKI